MCYGKTVEINDNKVDKKYCLSTIPLGEVLDNVMNQTNGQIPDVLDKRMLGTDGSTFGYYSAYCVPSTCKAKDLQIISDVASLYLAETFNISAHQKPIFSEKLCYSKATDPSLTAGAITTM